jgi:hypothetical protein
MTGWSLSWMLKRSPYHADSEALLTKTTPTGIVITGTFHATPAQNQQRATVTIADTDTENLPAGAWPYELKRTDPGAETILAYGLVELVRSVHHA